MAINRATRHVHVALTPSKSARSARAFPNEVIAKVPYRIHTLLTDNDKVNSRQRREGALYAPEGMGYKAFTDRIIVAGSRKPTGNQLFDRLCNTHDFDHRLIPIRRPQTNDMVERFTPRAPGNCRGTGHYPL